MDARRLFGNSGERLAEQFLLKHGMHVLSRQYRTRFGEIDLIVKDNNEIVFVEVKTRRGNDFGHPEESVTKGKLEKIVRTGEWYLQETHQTSALYRIDVVAITYGTGDPEIHHLAGVGG